MVLDVRSKVLQRQRGDGKADEPIGLKIPVPVVRFRPWPPRLNYDVGSKAIHLVNDLMQPGWARVGWANSRRARSSCFSLRPGTDLLEQFQHE